MYIFRPPTTSLPMGPVEDILWGRVTYERGLTVLKTMSGSYIQVAVYDPDMTGIQAVYLGGHDNMVDDAEAANLTAAGYGAYLEAV